MRADGVNRDCAEATMVAHAMSCCGALALLLHRLETGE
jgi:hypothetical protein